MLSYKAGTEHIAAWGHIQLTGAAKQEVENYAGVKKPLYEDYEVFEDRAVPVE